MGPLLGVTGGLYMVGLRLFLPENWTSDPARLDRAGVPDDHRAYRSKPEIALAEIDRVRAAGVRFGCVLADAGYGLSGHFRHGLSERGLACAVGVPFKQKVYPADVTMIFMIFLVAGRARPRKNAIPDITSVSARTMLEAAPWRKVNWRRGTKGQLSARFAAVRVRVADGPPQRNHDMGAHRLPGEEVWLIGEHRSTGERKYYLSNLPADTAIKQLAGAIKARRGLRAGAPATQGRTRSRPLRGPIMERPASTCADVHDRLRLPSVPPPQTGQGGKKESQNRRRNRASPKSGKPSLTESRIRQIDHAHTAGTGRSTRRKQFCQSSASRGPSYSPARRGCRPDSAG